MNELFRSIHKQGKNVQESSPSPDGQPYCGGIWPSSVCRLRHVIFFFFLCLVKRDLFRSVQHDTIHSLASLSRALLMISKQIERERERIEHKPREKSKINSTTSLDIHFCITSCERWRRCRPSSVLCLARCLFLLTYSSAALPAQSKTSHPCRISLR